MRENIKKRSTNVELMLCKVLFSKCLFLFGETASAQAKSFQREIKDSELC